MDIYTKTNKILIDVFIFVRACFIRCICSILLLVAVQSKPESLIILAVIRQSVQRVGGAHLRVNARGCIARFEKISQQWRAVGYIVSDLTYFPTNCVAVQYHDSLYSVSHSFFFRSIFNFSKILKLCRIFVSNKMQ